MNAKSILVEACADISYALQKLHKLKEDQYASLNTQHQPSLGLLNGVMSALNNLKGKIEARAEDIDTYFDVPTETAFKMTEFAQTLYIKRLFSDIQWSGTSEQLAEKCIGDAVIFARILRKYENG